MKIGTLLQYWTLILVVMRLSILSLYFNISLGPRQDCNEVCLFLAVPNFRPTYFMLDSKSVTNFGPWSHKNGTAGSLIPQKAADPNHTTCVPRSRGCNPRSCPSDHWFHMPHYEPSLPTEGLLFGSYWYLISQGIVVFPSFLHNSSEPDDGAKRIFNWVIDTVLQIRCIFIPGNVSPVRK